MNTLDTGMADKSTDNVDKPCEICTSRADSNFIGRGVGRFKAYCKSLMLRLTQRVVAKHSKGNTKTRARNCKAVKKNSYSKSKKGLMKS